MSAHELSASLTVSASSTPGTPRRARRLLPLPPGPCQSHTVFEEELGVSWQPCWPQGVWKHGYIAERFSDLDEGGWQQRYYDTPHHQRRHAQGMQPTPLLLYHQQTAPEPFVPCGTGADMGSIALDGTWKGVGC